MKTFYLMGGVTGIIATFVATYKYSQNENILWLFLGIILFISAMRSLWCLRKIIP